MLHYSADTLPSDLLVILNQGVAFIIMTSVALLKQKAVEHIKAGKHQNAIEVLHEAMELSPNDHTFYSNAAMSALALKNYESVVEYCNECIRLEPSFAKAYYRRATAYKALEMYKEALGDYKKAMELVPEDMLIRDGLKECERVLMRMRFEAAIRVPKFDLTPKCIEEIQVEDSYTGLRLENDINMGFCEELIEYYKQEHKLHPKYLYTILMHAKKAFEKEQNVHPVNVPKEGQLTICGDVHGQYFDVLQIFEKNGLPSPYNVYVFNGDFVDRGAHSVEVITLLLALKAAQPDSILLSRGNHESPSVNRTNSFFTEVTSKYSQETYDMFSIVFNTLPIAYVIEKELFVVHGGIPKGDLTIEEINKENRFMTPENGSLISQMLWSDPQSPQGLAMSPRGEGVLFGRDVTTQFLARNSLSKVIRSHVWEPEGYKIDHDGKCVTIFSAPDYTGVPSPAAYINVTWKERGLLLNYVQFHAASYQGKAQKPRPAVPHFF